MKLPDPHSNADKLPVWRLLLSAILAFAAMVFVTFAVYDLFRLILNIGEDISFQKGTTGRYVLVALDVAIFLLFFFIIDRFIEKLLTNEK